MVTHFRPPANAKGGNPPNGGTAVGRARRDAAHAQAEREHAAAILTARRMMAIWLLDHGSITADDVQDLIDLPPTTNPTILGGVPTLFARRRWIVAAGYEHSRRPQAHARPVIRWRLADAGAIAAWLRDHPLPEPAGVNR